MSSPSELDNLSRPELIELARRHGIERPERMTRVELRDAIIVRTQPPEAQAEARGLFGVARSMLATMVESGLNLPDAAALIRGTATFDSRVGQATPVATVTLAEIYAAQGHKKRALGMLDEVLASEPDHEVALRLRRELTEGAEPTSVRVEGEEFFETSGEEVESHKPPQVVEDVVEAAPTPAEADPPPAVAEAAAVAEPAAPPIEESEPAAPPGNPRAPHSGVVLQQTRQGVAVHWEVSSDFWDQARADGARPALRVVGFLPARWLPTREERNVELSPTLGNSGVVEFDELGAPAAVRAAVGWETASGFRAFAIGQYLEELGEESLSPVLRERLGLAAR